MGKSSSDVSGEVVSLSSVRDKKHKKSHDKAKVTAAVAESPVAAVSSSEERLLKLERELETLKYQLAVMEGLDVCRRFRHHLMYDLVKKFNIDVPPRMNTKKRTNFPLLLKAISDAGDKVPLEWRNAIRGLETLDATCQFPLGFWDSVDNSAITSDMIQTFVQKFSDPKLQSQVLDMCQCSLTCTPPCARGNGNSPSKGLKCPTMEDIQSGAKSVVGGNNNLKSSSGPEQKTKEASKKKERSERTKSTKQS